MSQSTTPNTEPRLCKMGCGFFGSGAMDDCCSKCFLEKQKKQNECVAIKPHPPKQPEIPMDDETPMEETPEPMIVDTPVVEGEIKQSPVVKKKKKTSYKAMMASMTKPTGSRDAEKDKESIRKATGGGAFSKIEKI